MAWLVSVKLQPFSAPSRVLPSRWEPHPKMPAQHVVSSRRAKRVAVNILLSARKQTITLSQDSFLVTVPSRQLFAPVSKLAHVSCCPRTLTGYWIGPDSEDGWGFAVAFIDKIL